jgi:hypothetical protein
MGDLVEIIGVEVIQGGVLQLDLLLVEEDKPMRVFCTGKDFFHKFGEAMEKLHLYYQSQRKLAEIQTVLK